MTLLARSRRKRKGQTLIYTVLLMVILLVVGIFLFDLQYFIRLRAKTQNGVDAAVLTAANWQGKSLNMIGELNLIRATTLLIDDINPSGDTTSAGIIASDELISQSQTRITYAGPLIGYISAQQAAKNNGLRVVEDFSASMNYHIDNNLEDVGGMDSLYQQAYGPRIPYNGYSWLEPYRDMLRQLAVEGMAVKAVNTRYLAGAPTLSGPGAAFLTMRRFYTAVWGRDYCWFYRMGLSSSDVYDFSSVEVVANETSYFPGSEFLNLYIGFQRTTINDSASWAAHTDPLLPFIAERSSTLLDTNGDDPDRLTALSELNWAVYDNAHYGWDAEQVVSSNPDVGLYAFVNQYLRSDIQSRFTYGGAAARMWSESQPSLISGRYDWKHGDDLDSGSTASLGDALDMGSTMGANAQRLKSSEARLQSLRERSSVSSVAAAKPFGHLADDRPYAAGIVLPVFEDVRLIPTALVHENDFDRDFVFLQFLTEYFGHPDYPNVPASITSKYWYYIQAIQMFQDHDSGFHDGWESWEVWRDAFMAGVDGIHGTSDDQRDPCAPVVGSGGGGGGGSTGGPSILH